MSSSVGPKNQVGEFNPDLAEQVFGKKFSFKGKPFTESIPTFVPPSTVRFLFGKSFSFNPITPDATKVDQFVNGNKS